MFTSSSQYLFGGEQMVWSEYIFKWRGELRGELLLPVSSRQVKTKILNIQLLSLLSKVAADDDGGSGFLSMLIFTAQPNIDYFVIVEGYDSSCGIADVRFEVMPAPPLPPSPAQPPSTPQIGR